MDVEEGVTEGLLEASSKGSEQLRIAVDRRPSDGHIGLTPRASPRADCFRLESLSRIVGETTILTNVTFEVKKRQIVGLIGPSGSGKSTLLRAFNRLWEPAAGTVFFHGQDITSLDVVSLRRRIGMLFQSPALFDGTVADNVRFGPGLRGHKLPDSEVAQLLDQAGLEPSLASKQARDLSGGQAQRAALARALANKPEVLLLDEPTSALDPAATRRVEETVLRLREEAGLTVVWVSHSVEQIQRVADVVLLLVKGEVVETSTPRDLLNSAHPLSRQFLDGTLE